MKTLFRNYRFRNFHKGVILEGQGVVVAARIDGPRESWFRVKHIFSLFQNQAISVGNIAMRKKVMLRPDVLGNVFDVLRKIFPGEEGAIELAFLLNLFGLAEKDRFDALFSPHLDGSFILQVDNPLLSGKSDAASLIDFGDFDLAICRKLFLVTFINLGSVISCGLGCDIPQ